MSVGDSTLASQREWASLGGLGPVPSYNIGTASSDESKAISRWRKELAIARQRHELRMRLIERALPAILSVAHQNIDAGRRLLDENEEPINAWQWASIEAVGVADTLLDRLAAEAKSSARDGAP